VHDRALFTTGYSDDESLAQEQPDHEHVAERVSYDGERGTCLHGAGDAAAGRSAVRAIGSGDDAFLDGRVDATESGGKPVEVTVQEALSVLATTS
jgi:hypothetical protein